MQISPTTSAKNSEFIDSVIQLDGCELENCSFVKCRLVFSGGALPKLVKCHFKECVWSFEGAAQSTLSFISMIYADGGTFMLDSVIEQIKAVKEKSPAK